MGGHTDRSRTVTLIGATWCNAPKRSVAGIYTSPESPSGRDQDFARSCVSHSAPNTSKITSRTKSQKASPARQQPLPASLSCTEQLENSSFPLLRRGSQGAGLMASCLSLPYLEPPYISAQGYDSCLAYLHEMQRARITSRSNS